MDVNRHTVKPRPKAVDIEQPWKRRWIDSLGRTARILVDETECLDDHWRYERGSSLTFACMMCLQCGAKFYMP